MVHDFTRETLSSIFPASAFDTAMGALFTRRSCRILPSSQLPTRATGLGGSLRGEFRID